MIISCLHFSPSTFLVFLHVIAPWPHKQQQATSDREEVNMTHTQREKEREEDTYTHRESEERDSDFE
jgi:hypothetical protein